MFGINLRSVRRSITDAFLSSTVFPSPNVFFESLEFAFTKTGCFCPRIANSGSLMSMLRSISIFCMMNNPFALARPVTKSGVSKGKNLKD